jgi:hypothetical protein
MNELIKLHAQTDHVIQWAKLKRLYKQKRGHDTGKNNKPIPRTTNGDIGKLTQWWHAEFMRGILRNPWASKPDAKRWIEDKNKIERDIKGADPAAVYRDNEWFWQEATRRISKHLESAKAVPSPTELLLDSFKETIADRAKDLSKGALGAVDAVSDAADAITDAGKRAVSMLKTGAIIAASVLGAAIVVPPVIRAMRKD